MPAKNLEYMLKLENGSALFFASPHGLYIGELDIRGLTPTGSPVHLQDRIAR